MDYSSYDNLHYGDKKEISPSNVNFSELENLENDKEIDNFVKDLKIDDKISKKF